MKPNVYTLYQYTHRETGRGYIGITRDLPRRRRSHARGKSEATLFNRAVLKYGIEAFDFKALALFDDPDAAAYHEGKAITALGTLKPGGFNLKAGTPGTQYAGGHSPETRAKLKELGSTPERRQAQSDSSKRMWADPEERERVRSSMRGHTLSPETRARMSQSQKGHPNRATPHPQSPETRARLAEIARARWADPEARAKMTANIGRKRKDG